jgi:hypothetical protein|uniref:Uncharacterized protein n=1 Tax=Myoviridae sp. ctWb16 TaxID=2827690 RepID=A0A8S5T138_9CAUD|nr:MAG TPA: hypothetical protein [Myoviridae sp. ctWb16]
MNKEHKKIVNILIKDLKNCDYDEQYLYNMLMKYKMSCVEKMVDVEENIRYYFNNYEIRYLKSIYQSKNNTVKFNEWVAKIFGFEYKKRINWQRNILSYLMSLLIMLCALIPTIIMIICNLPPVLLFIFLLLQVFLLYVTNEIITGDIFYNERV